MSISLLYSFALTSMGTHSSIINGSNSDRATSYSATTNYMLVSARRENERVGALAYAIVGNVCDLPMVIFLNAQLSIGEGMPVPDTADNMTLCLCGNCPTFKKSPLTMGFFCAKGKAKEQVKKSGCICGGCPIFSRNTLRYGYSCVGGKSA